MVVEIIAEWAVSVISTLGYFGVFFLMVLESMVFPIPSEVVMPLAGYLIHIDIFSWIWVVIASTLGSIIGSLISYYIGYYGGKKFVNKFGKYLLLNEGHLNWTEKFFNKRGERTIFISRFIPVVRHLISIPAGVGRMNLRKFLIYTTIGATIWNFILTYIGYTLADHWQIIHEYSRIIDWIILGILILLFIWWIYKRIKKK